jgi:galactose mutarotase-like enzyme
MSLNENSLHVKESIFGRALRSLVIENELLSVTVLLDQGADIYSLIYKPRNVDVLWKAPLASREPGVGPTPGGDSLSLWLAYYKGGWQVIFPNFGPAVEYKGALLDMHGEAARTAWQLDSIHNDSLWAGAQLSVRLLKSPFRIMRRMSLHSGQPVLSLSETIFNEGRETMDCMWGHHPAFGPPFLSEHCVLDTSAQTVVSDDAYQALGNDLPLGGTWRWPEAKDRCGKDVDLSKIPPPDSGYSRVFFLKDFQESWYAITNHQMRMGVGVVWDGTLFPFACVWQETGGEREYPYYGKAYVTAVEPNSSYPGHGLVEVMKTTGSHLTLGPDESRTLKLKVVFYEGAERVARINGDALVTRIPHSG